MNHLWLTQRVATVLNVAEGTDYRAVLLEEQDNIADAVLISESRQWPKRLIRAFADAKNGTRYAMLYPCNHDASTVGKRKTMRCRDCHILGQKIVASAIGR